MNHSPRDLLLGRHADAEARLDALRRAALPEAPLGWRAALRDLFFPHRAVWTALATVWAVVALVAGLSRSPEPSAGSAPQLTQRHPATAPVSSLALLSIQQNQYRALLAQMDSAR